MHEVSTDATEVDVFAPYRVTESLADRDLHQERIRAWKRTLELSELDEYRGLMSFLAALPRCVVRPLCDLQAPLDGDTFAVGLRHDMDDDPFASMLVAHALGEEGLPGTFYIHHTSLYYGEFSDGEFRRNVDAASFARTLQDAGCEVGLHTDGLWVYQQHGMDGSEAVRTEIEWLRARGINLRGTAAHNSAPIYGAENFEVFKGRAVFDRHVVLRNEQRIPLQTLSESELGLTYEANFPDVSIAQRGRELSRYLSLIPADAIRNPVWMRVYLLDNPYTRWGADYNAWLLGDDQWVLSGHRERDPVFQWDISHDELKDFVRQVPGGRRIVLHVHPAYIREPGQPRTSLRRRDVHGQFLAVHKQVLDLQNQVTELRQQLQHALAPRRARQRLHSETKGNATDLFAGIDDVAGALETIGPQGLMTLRQLLVLLAPVLRLARSARDRVASIRGRFADLNRGTSLMFLVPRALLRPRRRASNGGRRILMLTISQIDIDPRINKVARSLAAAGFEVDIVCGAWGSTGGVVEESVAPGVRYVRVPTKAGGRLWLIYQGVFLRAARVRAYDYVHANDLTTLLTGWLLARERGVPLVYDAHEMWSENVSPKGHEWVPMSWWTRRKAQWLEGWLVRDADALFTVSGSIVDEFRRRYRLRTEPRLVANFPDVETLSTAGAAGPDIRELCRLDSSHFVTLYLGGVNPLRNIENVVRAHQHLPPEYVFVIRGPGVEHYGPEYLRLAASLGLDGRVYCLPPVEMDEVISATRGADCGIVMLRAICNNFYWFYPNKFFEYMLAGLPVAVSNFPDVSAHIARERCGVVFDPESPQSIADALVTLGGDRTAAREMGQRGRAGILREYNWERAASVVVEAYRSLPGS